jgi:ketosteroid isomerase-like protein
VASANLDLVRSLYADWERGDFSSTEWAHPDIEFVLADGPAAGTWKGLAGMAEGFRQFVSVWEHHSAKAEEFRELDSERILVLVQGRGRGKISGLDFDRIRTAGASLVQIRGGKVTRIAIYADRENAFADLGLASEAGSPPS